MSTKFLLRVLTVIISIAVGVLLVALVVPEDTFGIAKLYLLLLGGLAFGVFGFVLPSLLAVLGRAGLTALTREVASHLTGQIGIRVGGFGRRSKKSVRQADWLIVDTSALIDGRILEVVKSGFLRGTLVIIPSVIFELQKLADSSDSLKRGRGRRGLDMISKLQAEKAVKVEVLESEPKDKEVDMKLVALAKKAKGRLLTVDFNLNKVAIARKVAVLNVNELAHALRPVYMAGEKFKIEIVEKGSGRDQGVGYLEDGTMIVVEGGLGYRGKKVEIEVLRAFQSAAGRMVFGKIIKRE